MIITRRSEISSLSHHPRESLRLSLCLVGEIRVVRARLERCLRVGQSPSNELVLHSGSEQDRPVRFSSPVRRVALGQRGIRGNEQTEDEKGFLSLVVGDAGSDLWDQTESESASRTGRGTPRSRSVDTISPVLTPSSSVAQLGISDNQQRQIGLLFYVLYGNSMILYSPNSTLINGVIGKANSTFVLLDSVTKYAFEWKNVSRILTTYFLGNGTAKKVESLRRVR